MRFTLLLIFALAAASASVAQTVPATLNFQGRLANASGAPVPDTAAQAVTFRLFDAPTAGNELWEQTLANVTVTKGTFAATLDLSTGYQGASTQAQAFSGAPVYIEVQAGADPPMTPRQLLSSSPYAFTANTALTVPDSSITDAKIASLSYAKLTGAPSSLPPSGPAAGDLAGNYPAPAIAPNVVGNSKLAVDNASLYRVSGGTLSVVHGAEKVDQQNTAADHFFFSYSGTIWQSFTPAVGGVLTALDLTDGPMDNAPLPASLAIYDGEGTGGTLLASQPFLMIGVYPPDFSFKHVVLQTPVPVTPGHKVTWAVTADNYTQLFAISDTTYPGGTGTSGYDMTFRAYVATPVWTPTVTASYPVSLTQGAGVLGGNVIEFGAGVAGKQNDAGKIGYATFDGSLDIVGAGTTGLNRKVTIYAEGGLSVAGTVYSNGTALSSDARYKRNVSTVTAPLDTIVGLRGVTFDWDRDAWPAKAFPEGRQIGFIAQEVEKVLPEVVHTDENGYKSVEYANVVPVLVEAVKTLKDDNDDLRAQVAALARSVAALQSRRRPDW